MSNQRYDVLSVRKYTDRDGQEKSAWTNVGVGFANKDGNGFSLSLHCFPAPDAESGTYRLVMRIPQERDDQNGQQRQQGQQGQQGRPAQPQQNSNNRGGAPQQQRGQGGGYGGNRQQHPDPDPGNGDGYADDDIPF